MELLGADGVPNIGGRQDSVRTPKTALIVAGLALTMVVSIVATAQAFPNKTSQCSGCHSLDAAVGVTTTQTSNDGTAATYSVSVSDAYGDGITGWAVFDGVTNLANGYGAGSFTVPNGKTYKVFGVAGAGGNGSNSVTVSPVAPPTVDTTPPLVSITSPAAGATVSGSVGITAGASDVGSGVARVEFRVDGTLLASDAASPYSATWNASGATAGTHTIQATAFDNAGLSTTVSIQVSIAAPPAASKSTVVVSVTGASGPISGAKVVAKNTVTGVRYIGVTDAAGGVQFAGIDYGTYAVSVSARRYSRASASLVVDAPTEGVSVSLSAR
jgi:hypothetical protein